MSRLLQDIVAELEAKYEGHKLLYDLNERRRVIADFDRDVEYMFSRFEIYEEDVRFVLEHKLDIGIIRRITMNLVLTMQQLCDSVLSYRHAIEFYLMDENYEKNRQLYYRFLDSHDRITSFFTKLNTNNVFNVENPTNGDVINRFLVDDEPEDTVVATVPTIIRINKEEIEQMNAAELIICLDHQLYIFQNNLWALKYGPLERDDAFMELIYALNYILYAKSYWPARCANFRAHIAHHRLRDKVDINGLERLKQEAIHLFEYYTPSGRIWRDYSENIAQMASQMKETFIKDKKNEDEEMWKYFFQNIF